MTTNIRIIKASVNVFPCFATFMVGTLVPIHTDLSH